MGEMIQQITKEVKTYIVPAILLVFASIAFGLIILAMPK